VEERVGRLRDLGQLELVAEICRVLRQHAVAEQPEDSRVLLLEAKLELRLELVELVEVAHAPESSFARRASTGPFPGTSRAGSSSASGSRTNRRSCSLGCGTSSPGSSIRASPKRRRSRSIVLGPPGGTSVRARPGDCAPRHCVPDAPPIQAWPLLRAALLSGAARALAPPAQAPDGHALDESRRSAAPAQRAAGGSQLVSALHLRGGPLRALAR